MTAAVARRAREVKVLAHDLGLVREIKMGLVASGLRIPSFQSTS